MAHGWWLVAALALSAISYSQVEPRLFVQNLSWRCIGPHRGGRTVGASGVPGRPNEFFVGVNNGGVWKTSDYGRTWIPVFDSQATGSIGCLAVSPANRDVIYVGSGEGLQRPDLSVGNGVYKSLDGGASWSNVGLSDGEQISGIAVHPQNSDVVYAAVLGHPHGPNPTRGLYRTSDGGKNWKKVLGPDDDTGASQVTLDPKEPRTVYCSLWAARQAPWENGRWQGPQSGLFKSTNEGETWIRLDKGLPTSSQGLGRIGLGVSPSNPSRLYATVDAREAGGIYRSEDAGATWNLLSTDRRLWSRGDDFAEIKVDPVNPDVVYCGNTACYKSVDGGATWVCWKGAPGGDDYHTIWIDPLRPEVVLLASDQGATITVNGGLTWSSWYNQPTAQFYHVSTDNQWPYWVYGGQQESGSVGICSRGNDGQITLREWHPVGVEEYGYVAVDPLDSNIVYGGKISKFDKRTGQVQEVRPVPPKGETYRFLRTAPVVFSPVDPKSLYFAGNRLFVTRNGAKTWSVISPDLSRERPDVPECFRMEGKSMAEPGRRGVIYAVAPSKFSTDTIWCGTDDGLVWLTSDAGKTWKDVTPNGLTSWSKVTQIDAGYRDDDTAYVSVSRIKCDDQKPYIYVTHDRGATWRLATNGLPNDPVNAVREDPKASGLLYCATERMVHFSLDDGANWHPLRQNMPCTSVRDLVVHGDDLVIGTHGRSFWIMDDMSQLRQQAEFGHPTLFAPQLATRVAWNLNTDTPMPPEEPGGTNPPDGAILNYWLPVDAKRVDIEIVDSGGQVVRTYSSEDTPYQADPNKIPLPTYWLRPTMRLGLSKGAHRWLWDMRYQPISEPSGWVTMAAIRGDTPTGAQGPRVAPGQYVVRLTVDGNVSEQKLVLRLDLRVKLSKKDLDQQTKVIVGSYKAMKSIDQELANSSAKGAKLLAELRSQFSDVLETTDASDMPVTDATLALYTSTVKRLQEWRKGKP
ncbi:MAG: hypothetical protein JNM34_08845 [Chthonomonadaceae bacterium]|nr:hypothetical protein [Chthonomonadaceae bacterium]